MGGLGKFALVEVVHQHLLLAPDSELVWFARRLLILNICALVCHKMSHVVNLIRTTVAWFVLNVVKHVDVRLKTVISILIFTASSFSTFDPKLRRNHKVLKLVSWLVSMSHHWFWTVRGTFFAPWRFGFVREVHHSNWVLKHIKLIWRVFMHGSFEGNELRIFHFVISFGLWLWRKAMFLEQPLWIQRHLGEQLMLLQVVIIVNRSVLLISHRPTPLTHYSRFTSFLLTLVFHALSSHIFTRLRLLASVFFHLNIKHPVLRINIDVWIRCFCFLIKSFVNFYYMFVIIW